MRDLLVLFVHLLTTLARLLGPGGARAVVGETLLIKHQLLILNRSRALGTEFHGDGPHRDGVVHVVRESRPAPQGIGPRRSWAFTGR